MGHVVLLGDSIFDNARYVPEKPAVIEQVRRHLPGEWKASLLAVDGHVACDVLRQLHQTPADATHLFVSAGGNNALGESAILREAACTVGEALRLLNDVQSCFRQEYQEMLKAVLALQKPTTICTVYDSIPGLGPVEILALGIFNDVILRSAFLARLPLIDLRLVCNEAGDYSHVSPIEPSHLGGAKIARLIAAIATGHDFSNNQCVIYR